MEKPIDCYVDRFEGELAVLMAGDKEIIFPRALLPADTVQGDYFLIAISKEPEKRQAAAREISDLQKRLQEEDR